MSLIDLLQTVGGRLGILESSTASTADECPKVVTRTVTLEELKSEIRSEEVRTLADLPAELAVPFEKIFEAAGVQPPAQGWNIARLKDLVQTETMRTQERPAVQKAILAALSSGQIAPEGLVKEAMAQDQALDAFEVFVCKKVESHMGWVKHQIAEHEARIQALHAEHIRLEERIRLDQEKLREWRRRKRAYERDLASTVGYLTDRPVISTDELPHDQ